MLDASPDLPEALAELRGPAPDEAAWRTLPRALQEAAALDHPLFTLHGGKAPCPLPARALLAGARAWAATLRAAGVPAGATVPILLPTSTDFVEALVGCMWAGIVPVPLASPMTFGAVDRFLSNLADVVQDAGSAAILTSPRMRDAIGRDPRLAGQLETILLPTDRLEAAEGPEGDAHPEIELETLAFLQYTSGTTGRPKGAMITHRALAANAQAIYRGLGLGPEDVGMSWLPLFHDMGLIGVLLTAIHHPYRVHFMAPEAFVMRPERWLTLLSETGATLSAAPNFAYELCVKRARDLGEHRLDRWRLALNGAEPVHRTTLERFAARFGPDGFRPEAALPVYGLAESTLAVTFTEPGAGAEILRVDRKALEEQGLALPSSEEGALDAISAGRPVVGARIRIRGPEGVLAERRVGAIETRGPSLMQGYYRNPEASAEALVDGWLQTGDLGFVHEGRLFIVGRAKEVVIKGGRNIYPYDIERVATELEDVVAAAAFGRGNPETGTDDLVVILETRARDEARRAELEKSLRAALLAAIGAKADEIHLWAVGSLPRTTSGKVRRAECARRVSTPANAAGELS